jgi:hypothetical protein
MAKPLGPKTLLIRDAITDHPDMGNKALAEMINGSAARKQDKIEVSANDIAQQKQAMKKAGAAPVEVAEAPAPAKKRGRPKGARRKPRAVAVASPAPSASPVDLLNRVFGLAQDCGGVAGLKTIVDRLAEMQG